MAGDSDQLDPRSANVHISYNASLARKGLLTFGALAVTACALTFPGLADLVFALGLEVTMYVIFMYVRNQVTRRVPCRGGSACKWPRCPMTG